MQLDWNFYVVTSGQGGMLLCVCVWESDCLGRCQGAYEDIGRDGIFAKDQDLKCFLTSPWAICAALQLQHAFEAQHKQQDTDVDVRVVAVTLEVSVVTRFTLQFNEQDLQMYRSSGGRHTAARHSCLLMKCRGQLVCRRNVLR